MVQNYLNTDSSLRNYVSYDGKEFYSEHKRDSNEEQDLIDQENSEYSLKKKVVHKVIKTQIKFDKKKREF